MVDAILMILLTITYFNNRSELKEKEERKKKFDDLDDLIDFGSTNEVSKKKVSFVNQVKANLPYALIVFSIKVSYFFDREKSLNFPEDPTLS